MNKNTKIRNTADDDHNAKKPFIGTIQQAKEWQRNNNYIQTGYRIGYNSTRLAFKSLFQLHNETGNVWTHLLGAIFFVVIGFYAIMYMQALKPEISADFCPVKPQECTVD